jgi:hypothetical protein
MCYGRYNYEFWYAQHAPGYSCSGYNNATGNSILAQKGACWVFDPTTKARKCQNNVYRTICMGKTAFLGFNASKTCSQTRTVSLCKALLVMTAWTAIQFRSMPAACCCLLRILHTLSHTAGQLWINHGPLLWINHGPLLWHWLAAAKLCGGAHIHVINMLLLLLLLLLLLSTAYYANDLH